MFEKTLLKKSFLHHQLKRDKYARWHAANEKSYEKHTSLFHSLCVRMWWIHTAIHPATQCFHYFTSSLIPPSLSLSAMDGWQTSWNNSHTFTSTQLIVSSRLTNEEERKKERRQTTREKLECGRQRGGKWGKNWLRWIVVLAHFLGHTRKASDVGLSEKAGDTSYSCRKWHPFCRQTDRQRSITCCCFPRGRDCSFSVCCYDCQTGLLRNGHLPFFWEKWFKIWAFILKERDQAK